MTDRRQSIVDLLKQEITVCDRCGCASCWQGIFLCDGSRTAGTKQVTVEYLVRNSSEHPSYWKTDKELLKND